MDPTRFLDEDDDRFETRLLRAAQRDEPPLGAMTRTEVALGLGVSASVAASATASATAKAASAHLGAGHTVAQVGAVSVAKWLGIGAVSGLVMTTGIHYGVDSVQRARVGARIEGSRQVAITQNTAGVPRSAARVTAVPAMESPARAGDGPAIAAFSATAPLEPLRDVTRPAVAQHAVDAREPEADVPARDAPSARLSFPDPVVGAPRESAHVASLSDELSILERARHALAAHQPSTVLRELDAYQRLPSARVLEAEAEMLAIEALLQQGNIGAAREHAARSLALAPNGPHSARLREIAASPNR